MSDEDELVDADVLQELVEKDEQLRKAAEIGQSLLRRAEELQLANAQLLEQEQLANEAAEEDDVVVVLQEPTSPSDRAACQVVEPELEEHADVDPAVLASLASIDVGVLIGSLEHGFIRLVCTTWLLAQPADYRIEQRQKLEEREANGESPLLSTKDAADLVRRAERRPREMVLGKLKVKSYKLQVTSYRPSAGRER